MDEKGKINSCCQDAHRSLGHYCQPIKTVLEASYNWGPIYDWLNEIADDVTLAHPGKVRAIAKARIKTDKIKVRKLAELAWTVRTEKRCYTESDRKGFRRTKSFSRTPAALVSS
jgi:hypothetical protein